MSMEPLKFKVRGAVVPAEELPKYADKAKPKIAAPSEPKFIGFVVEGFPPGMIDKAKRIADDDCRRWAAMDGEQRSKAIAKGERKPKLWDEAVWLMTAKP